MSATNFPEFNAAVTELTDRVQTLLTNVGQLESVANVQIAVDKAGEASASQAAAAQSESNAATSESAAEQAAASALAIYGDTTAVQAAVSAADGSRAAAAQSAANAATSEANAAQSAADAQAAVDGKQPLDDNLTALAALAGNADKLPYFAGQGAMSLAALTAKAREMLAKTTEDELRTFLGLGAAALLGAGGALGNVLRVGDFGYGWIGGDVPGGDWNSINTNGHYMAAGYANAPDTGWWMGQHEAHNGDWGTQTVHAFTDSYPRTMVRNKNIGVWQPWSRMLHSHEIVGALGFDTNGKPTAAVMQYLTNANGRLLRFADGTMFCFLRPEAGSRGAGTTGSIWVNFPGEFVGYPEIFLGHTTSEGYAGNVKVWFENITPTGLNLFVSNMHTAALTVFPYILATGRWTA